MYGFHGGVGVGDKVFSADEQDLISGKNVQPANDVKVVETKTKTRSFAGHLWSIANTWGGRRGSVGVSEEERERAM